MFSPNQSTHNSQSFDISPPPFYFGLYPEVSGELISQGELAFLQGAIKVENESQLIGGGLINEFQLPSPMSHVHRQGQHAGSIGVDAYAVRPIMTQLPVMTPLASVRSDYNDSRTIVIDSGDVANSQEHYQCHDHLAYSSVDTSHFLHTNTPNKDTPGRPVDTKCRSTVKPTGLLMRNSMASAQNARYDLNFNGGPEDMRNQLVQLESVNGNLQEKCFSKEPKANVTSAKSREASDSRRKTEAKFTCPFEGCNGNFTRKHNLDNHLKAHCGVTDFMCDLCNKSFTTLPVLKRHIKTCEIKQNIGERIFLKSLTL